MHTLRKFWSTYVANIGQKKETEHLDLEGLDERHTKLSSVHMYTTQTDIREHTRYSTNTRLYWVGYNKYSETCVHSVTALLT